MRTKRWWQETSVIDNLLENPPLMILFRRQDYFDISLKIIGNGLHTFILVVRLI